MDPRTQQASGDTQEWGREWGVELASAVGKGCDQPQHCLAWPLPGRFPSSAPGEVPQGGAGGWGPPFCKEGITGQ